MATATTGLFHFHLFSNLPPELQDEIWRAALPDRVGSALYFYKKRVWRPEQILKSNEFYKPKTDESDLEYEFHHDILDSVQVDIPLFFVSREARGVALAWIREHNIEIRAYADENKQLQSPVFASPFDLLQDVLYVAHDQWEDFLNEPSDRMFEPDMIEKLLHSSDGTTVHLAMPVTLFENDSRNAVRLYEIIDMWYSLVSVLYLIVDTPLALQPTNNGRSMQSRWGLENMKGGSFVWNCDRRCFDFSEGEHLMDPALYKLIDGITKSLSEEYTPNSFEKLEVRPVLAVKF